MIERPIAFLIALILFAALSSIVGNILIDRKILEVTTRFAKVEHVVQESERFRSEILDHDSEQKEINHQMLIILREIQRDIHKDEPIPPESQGGS